VNEETLDHWGAVAPNIKKIVRSKSCVHRWLSIVHTDRSAVSGWSLTV
jgi:hypothetical protein